MDAKRLLSQSMWLLFGTHLASWTAATAAIWQLRDAAPGPVTAHALYMAEAFLQFNYFVVYDILVAAMDPGAAGSPRWILFSFALLVAGTLQWMALAARAQRAARRGDPSFGLILVGIGLAWIAAGWCFWQGIFRLN